MEGIGPVFSGLDILTSEEFSEIFEWLNHFVVKTYYVTECKVQILIYYSEILKKKKVEMRFSLSYLTAGDYF